MSNPRIMPPRLFRWLLAFALILAALPLLVACGSADEPERESRRDSAEDTRDPEPTRGSRIFETLRTREPTPAPTERSRSIIVTRGVPAPTEAPAPAPTATRRAAPAPTAAPTRALTPTPVPEGWVLTESEAIHRSAYSGEAADVERLLDRGADTGAQASLANAKLGIEAYRLTPLHLAAAFNPNVEVAELLLEWGANVEATDYHGRTVLHWAAWNASPSQVEQLLDWGASIDASAYDPYYNASGWRPLHFAAAHNPDTAVVELLLDWSADMAATDNYRATALHRAAQYNPNTDVANFLLEWGANIEALANNNETPLHYAVFNPSPDMASLLLNRGANIEAQGYASRTPLHQAALNLGSPEEAAAMVRMLLERGANIEALDSYNRTPLLLVAQEHQNVSKQSGERVTAEEAATMIEALLDGGANIEAQRDGWTALLWAAYHDQPEIAELLLDRGADSKVKNNDGQTPCQVARQRDSFTGTPLLGRLCRP